MKKYMTLKELEEGGACWSARNAFSEKFGKRALIREALLKAVDAGAASWISWFVARNLSKAKTKLLIKMAEDTIDKALRRELKSKSAIFKQVREYLSESKRFPGSTLASDLLPKGSTLSDRLMWAITGLASAYACVENGWDMDAASEALDAYVHASGSRREFVANKSAWRRAIHTLYPAT